MNRKTVDNVLCIAVLGIAACTLFAFLYPTPEPPPHPWIGQFVDQILETLPEPFAVDKIKQNGLDVTVHRIEKNAILIEISSRNGKVISVYRQVR